jgi:rhodanese-related sulfurtransferase
VAVLESQTKTVRQIVAEAKGRVESLSVEQAAAEIGGGDVTLVDVCEDDERFLEGAIPGSVHEEDCYFEAVGGLASQLGGAAGFSPCQDGGATRARGTQAA